MKRVAAVILALMLGSAVYAQSQKAAASAAPAGPPVLPYQMRMPMPARDRLLVGRDGAALFSHHCGYCHLAGGMGTNLLTKQMIAAGQPPQMALLANRTDLDADYVKSVVRMGKVAMPRISRAEVTDAELDAIAAYLARAGQ